MIVKQEQGADCDLENQPEYSEVSEDEQALAHEENRSMLQF